MEALDADRGYLDKYFTGWVDPANSNCWTMQHRPELLVAYVGGAHAAGDIEALKILDRSAMAD